MALTRTQVAGFFLLFAAAWAHAAPADAGGPAFSLGLPDRPWRLYMELPGFEMGTTQRSSRSARALGTLDRLGLTVSLTLATSPGDPSARSCRDHDWAGRQKLQPSQGEARLTADGDQARVELLVPGGGGAPAEKQVLLYLQRDGVCAVVHLTKVRYQPSDAQTLEQLLASVRLGD